MISVLASEAARFHAIKEAARAEDHDDGQEGPASADTTFEALALEVEGGPPLTRPCVDCGLVTSRYCDGDEFGEVRGDLFSSPCLAVVNLPKGDSFDEEWNEGQRTPLCSFCDKKYGACHFCREENVQCECIIMHSAWL